MPYDSKFSFVGPLKYDFANKIVYCALENAFIPVDK